MARQAICNNHTNGIPCSSFSQQVMPPDCTTCVKLSRILLDLPSKRYIFTMLHWDFADFYDTLTRLCYGFLGENDTR